MSHLQTSNLQLLGIQLLVAEDGVQGLEAVAV